LSQSKKRDDGTRHTRKTADEGGGQKKRQLSESEGVHRWVVVFQEKTLKTSTKHNRGQGTSGRGK